MAELKTKPTDASVEAFLDTIPDETKRQDSYTLLAMMQEVTGFKPRMWGESIVGFGSYHTKYGAGREADWPLVGFSPRKQNLTLYIMSGFDEYDELLGRLGKHSLGKACLYVKRLKDVDIATLRELVRLSAEHMAATNPPGHVA